MNSDLLRSPNTWSRELLRTAACYDHTIRRPRELAIQRPATSTSAPAPRPAYQQPRPRPASKLLSPWLATRDL
ncbi:UNVERIFIED_CONTAM: hypothetical protein Slati_4557600 [Sesamum latifolium]|uniref:Uncharacterized protein n=1 Tax=Sesamum latifolium TaxID=2727402 RepID=A0AAW2S230_9LAMI